MVKENRTENLGEPPKPHQKDKSVNYNDELKNVWAVLNEMKATLNLKTEKSWTITCNPSSPGGLIMLFST